jgi:hypothetical protein
MEIERARMGLSIEDGVRLYDKHEKFKRKGNGNDVETLIFIG